MRKFLLGVSAVAAVTLTGCDGDNNAASTVDSTPTSTSSADQSSHNEQDVTFAQGMVPHHQHGVDMAKMAGEKATSASVKDLASRIGGAQDEEIQQMTGMLEQWGAPTTSGMEDGMSADEMGMMTPDEMQQLEQTTGAAFDRLWVELMIKHHQGAVNMARTELAQGENADAKALAQKILDVQEAEITEMRALA
ncbi:DUF305 domain-containing protein [Actinophytocola sp.]|uniref:DUF305 domain-containing protein n=1 Tax=Actinophytocola sp. TaxID=1872138 RepID=UPI002ED5F38A